MYLSLEKSNLPCPRASTGLVSSQQMKKLFIIGGADREKVFNDFSEILIDCKDNTQQLFGKEINLKKQPSMFSPRFGHTLNLINNTIYIFGGQNQFTQEQNEIYYFSFLNRIYNDLFCYNIIEDELTKLSAKNLPSARNSHSSCYEEQSNSIFIYGGANNEGPLNDLHCYNIKTNEFQQLQFDSEILQGREMHTMHAYSGNIKFEKQDSVMITEEFKFEKLQEGKIISADFSGNQQQQQKQSQQSEQQQQQQEVHQVLLISNKIKFILKQNLEFKEDNNLQQKSEPSLFSSLIIIGGRTLDSISQCIYLIDSQLDVHIIKQLPQPICSHSSCLYKNCIYIYGGTNGKQFFNDIYIMELSSNNLFRCKLEEQLISQMLTQRIASSMTIMDDNIIIYGGSEIEKENGEFCFISTEHYSTTKNSELC